MRIAIAATGLVSLGVWGAPGSWVAPIPRQAVVPSERAISTPPLTSNIALDDARTTRAHWRFVLEAGTQMAWDAWLCRVEDCVRLPGPRGMTRHFAGQPAAGPYRLRFRLRDADAAAVGAVVTQGTLTVDYRVE